MKSWITLAAATLATLAAPAMAAGATTLQFGAPLVGNGATLDVGSLTLQQIGDGDDWRFTLAVNDLRALVGGNAPFVGTMAVNASGATPNLGSGLAMTGVTGGVNAVSARNGGGPLGNFDFRFSFGNSANRLSSNETVSWTWMNSGHASFSALALQVQGVQPGQSSWYSGAAVTAAVPEPETWALMLAGGLLIGTMRLRREAGAR